MHWSIGPLGWLRGILGIFWGISLGCLGEILGISWGYHWDIFKVINHWFIIGSLVHCSIGSLVNMVNFSSERTSGVPPIIFLAV